MGVKVSKKDRKSIWCQEPSHSVCKTVSYLDINHLLFSRCLAHIINLATQALIKTRSEAKYYSPHEEVQEDLDADAGAERDELGLVRAICVKVCVFNLKLDCIPKKIPGPIIISTERTFQRNAGWKESSRSPTLAWYESSVEFNIYNAPSCRGSTRGN